MRSRRGKTDFMPTSWNCYWLMVYLWLGLCSMARADYLSLQRESVKIWDGDAKQHLDICAISSDAYCAPTRSCHSLPTTASTSWCFDTYSIGNPSAADSVNTTRYDVRNIISSYNNASPTTDTTYNITTVTIRNTTNINSSCNSATVEPVESRFHSRRSPTQTSLQRPPPCLLRLQRQPPLARHVPPRTLNATTSQSSITNPTPTAPVQHPTLCAERRQCRSPAQYPFQYSPPCVTRPRRQAPHTHLTPRRATTATTLHNNLTPFAPATQILPQLQPSSDRQFMAASDHSYVALHHQHPYHASYNPAQYPPPNNEHHLQYCWQKQHFFHHDLGQHDNKKHPDLFLN